MSSARYSILPARAVFDQSLTLADKVVLAALGTYTDRDGWCFPSQKELVQRLDISRSTVCAAIKRLSDKGYIQVRPRTTKGRGKIGNEYRVSVDLPPMSGVSDIGRQRVETAPMSDQSDIGKKPMSTPSDIGAQVVVSAPMSDKPDNGADVRLAGQPMSDQPDIATKDITTPFNDPIFLVPRPPLGDAGEQDRQRRAAYEAAERAKREAKAKPSRAKKPAAYSKDFELIWLAWPKNRRANSDKRKAFERYQAGVDRFGADAIAAAAKRYLSLPDTRKDQWKYCRLVEVFMNGGLEAAVEAALEDQRAEPINGSDVHERDRDQAARSYFEKRGKWPPGYTPPEVLR